MGSSEPLPIVDSDKRRKKKRKTRATDSLPGKFEGWSGPESGLQEGRGICDILRTRFQDTSPQSQVILVISKTGVSEKRSRGRKDGQISQARYWPPLSGVNITSVAGKPI